MRAEGDAIEHHASVHKGCVCVDIRESGAGRRVDGSPLAAITQMYCRWSSDTRCSLRAHMHVFAYIHSMSMLVIIRVCLLSLLNLTGVCLTHRLQT